MSPSVVEGESVLAVDVEKYVTPVIVGQPLLQRGGFLGLSAFVTDKNCGHNITPRKAKPNSQLGCTRSGRTQTHY